MAIEQITAERDAYKAQLVRLRAALEKIGKVSVGIEEKNGALRAWGDCARIARAALAYKSPAPVESVNAELLEALVDYVAQTTRHINYPTEQPLPDASRARAAIAKAKTETAGG